MFSKWDKGIVLLACYLGNLVSASAQQVSAPNANTNAVPAELTVKSAFSVLPAKCITLTQGRQCFATVTFTWQAPIQGNYCIYQVGKKEALDCWFNQKQNSVTFEFESNKTMHYQLIAYDFDKVIAETTVEVSWVHKASPRKRRWRIF